MRNELSKTQMTVRLYSAEFWEELCLKFLRRFSQNLNKTRLREIKELFGVPPKIVCIVWNALAHKLSPKHKPQYMLCALLFLKQYSTELSHAIIAGCDVKTFRNWSWVFVELIASLPVVRRLTKLN